MSLDNLPHVRVSSPAQPHGTFAVLANDDGAFDLPSILVGVVTVGILTAGVLASVFGIIPFAQDQGAQQDLDSLRTAEGVSKTKDGAYKASAGLDSGGLQKSRGSLAADTDGPGSCYVGITKSGSGKLFYSSNSAPGALELTDATNTGCISSGQRDAMITAVGGTPGGGSSAEGVIYTPVAARAGVTTAVTGYMNARIAWDASPLVLAAAALDASGGDSNAAWDAVFADPVSDDYYAAETAKNATAESEAQFKNMTESGAVSGLAAAETAADTAFWDNPTVATQQALADAHKALFTAAITLPDTRLVATASNPNAFNDVTIPAGTSGPVIFEAALPSSVDATNYGSFAVTSRGAALVGVPTTTGANDGGAVTWHSQLSPGGPWVAGVYKVGVFLTDPATKITYYASYKVTVTP